MPRIDLTTRELRHLIEPVLPHASTDASLPALQAIRLEVDGLMAYAVATDRYTLAAERFTLAEAPGDTVIYLDAKELSTALKLFPCSKDDDPRLKVTVDQVHIPTGRDDLSGFGLGLTIEAATGTRVTLHDAHELGTEPFGSWRKTLGRLLYRKLEPASPSLLLSADHLGRWVKAVRGAERLKFFAGPGPIDPVLVLVEEHFAGVWQPAGQLDAGQPGLLTGSPWRGELGGPPAEDAA